MRILLALLSCVLSTACVQLPPRDPMTLEDWQRQATFYVVSAADKHQTKHIANNPETYHEINPILGKHPSTEQVELYFAAYMAVNTAIAWALPRTWREWWQELSVLMEVGYVAHNYSLGIKLGF